MSVLTDEELSIKAQQIKNETARKANTATRVGTLFQDLIDSKLNGGPVSLWDFANSGESPGDYPTDLTKVYITVDDSVYPANTWFVSDGAGGWYTK